MELNITKDYYNKWLKSVNSHKHYGKGMIIMTYTFISICIFLSYIMSETVNYIQAINACFNLLSLLYFIITINYYNDKFRIDYCFILFCGMLYFPITITLYLIEKFFETIIRT